MNNSSSRENNGNSIFYSVMDSPPIPEDANLSYPLLEERSDSAFQSIIEDTNNMEVPTKPSTETYAEKKTDSFTSPPFSQDNYIEKPRGHIAEPVYVRNGNNLSDSILFSETQSHFTSMGYSPAFLASVSYFFTAFGGFLIMIFEKKNHFVIFHAWQSIISGTFAFLLQVLFWWSNTMYTVVWILYLFFLFSMILRVLYDAPSQRLYKLPLIGDFCDHQAFNKVQFYNNQDLYHSISS